MTTSTVSSQHTRRHCEPTGPAVGRPDDKLREAISRPVVADVGYSIRHHPFSLHCYGVRERCRAAHPGGLSCQIVGFEPFASPSEGSGAPKSRAGTPTRWSALRQDLSLLREGTAGP